MRIKEYIDSIDTSSYSDGIISVVLYNKQNNTHLYLFNFDYGEEGYEHCTMLNEPISKELPYAELSVPFIDDLDQYYDSYSPIINSNDVGKHYMVIMRRLKRKEEKLLRS